MDRRPGRGRSQPSEKVQAALKRRADDFYESVLRRGTTSRTAGRSKPEPSGRRKPASTARRLASTGVGGTESGPSPTQEVLDAPLRDALFTQDDQSAVSYELPLGRFACTIGPTRYEFDLSKGSAKYERQAMLRERKYTVAMARGFVLFNEDRYKWASLVIDYSRCMPPTDPSAAQRRKVAKIEYINSPDPSNPDQCTLTPLPAARFLSVLVPLAIRICEGLFPGAAIELQDAATVDKVVRHGDTPSAYRVSLSAAKLLGATSRYSAYGAFGFHCHDKPQERLDKLTDVFTRLGVGDAFTELFVTRNDDAVSFFAFDDMIDDDAKTAAFQESAAYLEAYVEELTLLRNKFDEEIGALTALGCSTPSLVEPISVVARVLLSMVDGAATTPAGGKLARHARQAFFMLQLIFLGWFSRRYQTLDIDVWRGYAQQAGVGAMERVVPRLAVSASARISHPLVALEAPWKVASGLQPVRPQVAQKITENRRKLDWLLKEAEEKAALPVVAAAGRGEAGEAGRTVGMAECETDSESRGNGSICATM